MIKDELSTLTHSSNLSGIYATVHQRRKPVSFCGSLFPEGNQLSMHEAYMLLGAYSEYTFSAF
jgi:hypothetical protein